MDGCLENLLSFWNYFRPTFSGKLGKCAVSVREGTFGSTPSDRFNSMHPPELTLEPNKAPQCHPPQEIAGLIKGLVTIGFP